jgi:DNA-binding winged helix-turn-helix (wHTH) protein
VLLVTRHGQIVTRDEMAKCLWEQAGQSHLKFI